MNKPISETLKTEIKVEDPPTSITQEVSNEINNTEESQENTDFKDIKDLGTMDDDGEDLPDNFFDDFSNNDFMAGLDIVDDWMDEDEDPEKKQEYFLDDIEVKEEISERKHGSRRGLSPRRSRRSRDDRYRRGRRSRSRDRHRDERRSKEAQSSRGQKPSTDVRISKDKDQKPVEENLLSRRDPEKTKQDIERDKIRCAKDFEARVFQEQIKVAESGLAPPGTELEIVLEHEKKKQEEEQKNLDKKKEDQVQEERKRSADKKHLKTRERRSPERSSGDKIGRDRRSRERLSRERRSRERRSRERRSRERRSRERRKRSRERRSLERRSLERRRSRERLDRDLREYRSRKREYNRLDRSTFSPRRRSRSLDREELLRINDDLRLRIREKRRERYLNELSPVSEARFSRSPSLSNLSLLSNISQREFWLRNREKYKSRYRRSCSPVSSSSLSNGGSPRRKRKKTSFMEEIEKKLQEQTQIPPHPVPPQPVPPPQQFPQMEMQFQNPQIFPGMVPNPYVQVVDHSLLMQQQYMNQPVMDQPMVPQGLSPMHFPQQVEEPRASDSPKDANFHRTQSNLKPCVSDTNKELTKLFEEQKISLSDYLSVSAKPIDPTLPPINVHKKIKVISKCQDVIRVLKDGPKFCGRFFPKPAPPGYGKPEEKSSKWKSPMKKTFPVRFMFTTPCRKPPSQQEFVKSVINKLLFVCGIPGIPEAPKICANKPQNIPATYSAPIPKINPAPVSFTVAQQKPTKNVSLPQQSVLIQRSSTGCQTDPVKCQICEIRSARKFNNEACQTIKKETMDESTQVTNEDLQKSIVTFTPRGILKNFGSNLPSLSHLTPAQLLQSDDGWNIASRNEPFSASRNEPFVAPRNEPFSASRNLQDQFLSTQSPSGVYGRNVSNFNSRLSANTTGFNSNFGGSPEKFLYKSMSDIQNMGSRNIDNTRSGNYGRLSPEGGFNDQINYNRNMGIGGNMGISGNMGSSGNMSSIVGGNLGSLSSGNTNLGNMGMGNNMSRGRGSGSNHGYYGGQNRQFYN